MLFLPFTEESISSDLPKVKLEPGTDQAMESQVQEDSTHEENEQSHRPPMDLFKAIFEDSDSSSSSSEDEDEVDENKLNYSTTVGVMKGPTMPPGGLSQMVPQEGSTDQTRTLPGSDQADQGSSKEYISVDNLITPPGSPSKSTDSDVVVIATPPGSPGTNGHSDRAGSQVAAATGESNMYGPALPPHLGRIF